MRPFTDKQIELVQNFAAQAVIAIENTRLLNELRQRTDDLSESLEQQTATTEVLKVIHSSPGELEPVFQAMLENATRLCDAKFGSLFLYDGEAFRTSHCTTRHRHMPTSSREAGSVRPRPIRSLDRRRPDETGGPHSRSQRGTVLHRPQSKRVAPCRACWRTYLLGVPMLKDDELIGAITIYRQEVRPFTDKQIELVQNFAAQAVIAIENARLLNELRQRTDDLSESLEQQTATSEVLKVISSARPANLEPVFDAMLANAMRICGAKFGVLSLREGDAFRVVANARQRQRHLWSNDDANRWCDRPRDTTWIGCFARKTSFTFQMILSRSGPAPTLARYGGARALVNVPDAQGRRTDWRRW